MNYKQECIPVGYVLPAALAIWGISTRHPPGADLPPRSRPPGPASPGGQTPWEQTPLTRHPPGGRHPPRSRHPSCGQNSWHTLLKILPCPILRLPEVMNNILSLKTMLKVRLQRGSPKYIIAHCERDRLYHSHLCSCMNFFWNFFLVNSGKH